MDCWGTESCIDVERVETRAVGSAYTTCYGNNSCTRLRWDIYNRRGDAGAYCYGNQACVGLQWNIERIEPNTQTELVCSPTGSGEGLCVGIRFNGTGSGNFNLVCDAERGCGHSTYDCAMDQCTFIAKHTNSVAQSWTQDTWQWNDKVEFEKDTVFNGADSGRVIVDREQAARS